MAIEAAPDSLARRLERWRAAHPPSSAGGAGSAAVGGFTVARGDGLRPAAGRARRLAETLNGSVVHASGGTVVRIERPPTPLPVARAALAELPGLPPPDVPLVCLDTETTGLGTATGTLAFLIGLGWWEGADFRQVQLVLPDHADEAALLAGLARAIPPDAWLVTYNGRGFDWPLLETRYRMGRGEAPVLAGHLDLLPFVRRVFRHRLPDARLRSVERHVIGVHRVGDVDGWEIPGRYLDMLRGSSPELLTDVVHHNHLDVLSLARLVALVASVLADPAGRSAADPRDLAALARLLRRAGRFEDALACLDVAIDRLEAPATAPPVPRAATILGPSNSGPSAADGGPWTKWREGQTPGAAGRQLREAPPIDAWWEPRRRADFGGPPRPRFPIERVADPTPWTLARAAGEQARSLRALGRFDEAVVAWSVVAGGRGREAALAWIEIAKLREHRLHDPAGAVEAVDRARRILERARLVGWPDPRLERSLDHRAARLRRRSGTENVRPQHGAADGAAGVRPVRRPVRAVPAVDSP